MKSMISLIGVLIIGSAQANNSFQCLYQEADVVHFEIKGALDEEGGVLSLSGNYVTGYDEKQAIKFYRREAKNEDSNKFARFDNKTPVQREAGTFLRTYYDFAMPKDELVASGNEFTAYFNFYQAPVEETVLEDGTVEKEIIIEENIKESLPQLKCIRLVDGIKSEVKKEVLSE